jgi:glutamate-1-semialdehyde 2,1-aminomutase
MEIMKRERVVEHFWNFGARLVNGLNDIAKEMGIEKHFYAEGFPCSPNYITKDKDGSVSLALRTLFAQEMVKHGVLIPYIAVSFSHKDAELDKTLSAAREALKVYSKALNDGVQPYLNSKVIKPVFRKYN